MFAANCAERGRYFTGAVSMPYIYWQYRPIPGTDEEQGKYCGVFTLDETTPSRLFTILVYAFTEAGIKMKVTIPPLDYKPLKEWADEPKRSVVIDFRDKNILERLEMAQGSLPVARTKAELGSIAQVLFRVGVAPFRKNGYDYSHAEKVTGRTFSRIRKNFSHNLKHRFKLNGPGSEYVTSPDDKIAHAVKEMVPLAKSQLLKLSSDYPEYPVVIDGPLIDQLCESMESEWERMLARDSLQMRWQRGDFCQTRSR